MKAIKSIRLNGTSDVIRTNQKPTKTLLGIGNNAKTIKSDLSDSEYKTGIMYLAPYTSAAGINVCPMADLAKCHEGCLNKSGLAAVYKTIEAARIRKTEFFRDDQEAFMAILVKDIKRELRKARREGYLLAIRLNGTSDVIWEAIALTIDGIEYKNIFQAFPSVIFYDYSKNVSVARIAAIAAIPNYSVTASYSEASAKYAHKIANQSALNIAVVFSVDQFKKLDFDSGTYTLANGKKLPLINGDINDERYLDKTDQQYCIALKAKGPAKKDTTGFVIRDINAHNQTIAVAA